MRECGFHFVVLKCVNVSEYVMVLYIIQSRTYK